MDLTVALCTYNGSKYLEPQLESILSQTRRPDEILVCDDASTDGTRSILRSYEREWPELLSVRYNDDNLGVTKNFEKAIAASSGDLIAISDQDDLWAEDKLERQLAALRRHDADLVFHDSRIVSSDLEPRGRLWDGRIGSFDPSASRTPTETFAELTYRNVVQGATMLFRADCREDVLPIPEQWQYDHYVALVVAATGRLHAIDEPLLRYRQHSEQDIGAPEGGGLRHLVRGIRDALEIHDDYLREIAADWRLLVDILSSMDDERFEADPTAVRELAREKARYGEKRSAFYDPTLPKRRRLRELVDFFLSDGYDGFANRWGSAPKDALVVLLR